MKKIGKN